MRVSPYRVLCIDNSCPLNLTLNSFLLYQFSLRIYNNLGHVGSLGASKDRLLGWSLSWILSALVAYSENCDFVYKEQDCLAFGNWLPRLKNAYFTYGRSQAMPCEQSLFYIQRDAIPDIVAKYLAIPETDYDLLPEYKFLRIGGAFHDVPGGRDRPLPNINHTFYAQRITPGEMQMLYENRLLD